MVRDILYAENDKSNHSSLPRRGVVLDIIYGGITEVDNGNSSVAQEQGAPPPQEQ